MDHGRPFLVFRFSYFWYRQMLGWLTLWMFIQLAYGLKVHLKYSANDVTTLPVPDAINVTLEAIGSSTPTVLRLHKMEDRTPNLPLYSLNVGIDGKFIYKREKLKDKNNIAYYQDVENEAVVQVTKVTEGGQKTPHLILKGEVSIGGQKYALGEHNRWKRSSALSEQSLSLTSSSSSSSTSNEAGGGEYDIHIEPISPATRHDAVVAPEEVRISKNQLQLQAMPVITLSNPSEQKASSSRDGNQDAPHDASPQSSSTSSSSSSSSTSSSSKERQRRQTTPYYVDVVALADYGLFKRFFDSSGSRQKALEDIREYVAFVFSGVDLRYQTISTLTNPLRVRLTKVVVAETSGAAPFTEQFRVPDPQWDEVDAQRALNAFSEFSSGSGEDFLLPYDHAMLMSGYDLTYSVGDGGKTNSTTGLAYTSTLCRTDGKSVSVVEDLGGFQSVDTAAHELGHGLSARHDGDGNSCSSSDRYIMAAGSSSVTDRNRQNPWRFSSCTIDYFREFINRQMRTARGRSCLTQGFSTSASVPDVSDRLPGQEISPDDQCRMIYGPESRLCRGTEFGESSNICTSMFCFDPSTTGTCFEQTAARGTSCGNGKVCLNGACVADSRAPALDETCPFGDQPGTAFESMTCSEFVASFPGYCYQLVVRGRCCASCKAVYRPVTDCMYGDKVRGCDSDVCAFAGTSYKTQCCGSCNYGDPLPTTGTTRPGTTPSITTTRRTTTTTTLRPVITTRGSSGPIEPVCEDNPNVLVNGFRCPVAIAMYPSFCYQDNIHDVCCASCENIDSGIEDCEFGDRYPVQCSAVTSCFGIERECCKTCSDEVTTVTTRRPTTIRTTPSPRPVIATTTTTTSSPWIGLVTEAECVDISSIRVNGMSCATAMTTSPELCYQQAMRDACCRSCENAHSGVASCSYGDEYPEVCRSLTSCDGYEEECCGTCGSFSKASGLVADHALSLLLAAVLALWLCPNTL